jgi:hypothetical protein
MVHHVFFRMMCAEQIRSLGLCWLEVIYRQTAAHAVLVSFQHALRGKAVTLLTDRQNCALIVRNGSSKPDLQQLALDIFTWCRRHSVV